VQVALPELDGAMEPIVFAGRDSNTGKSHSLPDRITSLCSRAIKWANLRKKKNAEKRLAVTVFSFPPDKVSCLRMWLVLVHSLTAMRW